MSSDTVMVHYGLRLKVGSDDFAVTSEDFELLERQQHPLQQNAIERGLDAVLMRVDPTEAFDHYLFIGKYFGLFSADGFSEKFIEDADYILSMKEVREKIGLMELKQQYKIGLWIVFVPDW